MPSEPGGPPDISEHKLAEVAIKFGKVAPPQVTEALELAAKMRDLGVERDLLGALVDKKHITREVADDLRRRAAAAMAAPAPAAPMPPTRAPAEDVGLVFDDDSSARPSAKAPPGTVLEAEEVPEAEPVLEAKPGSEHFMGPPPADGAPCAMHPERVAISNCRHCAKPVCSECIVRTERGSFCSRECLMNWQLGSAAKAEARASAAVRSLWIGKLLVFGAIIAVLAGVGWFVKHVYDGYRYTTAITRARMPRTSPEQTIIHLRTAVSIRPESVDARILLGKALQGRGEAGQAIEMLEKALEIDSGNVEALSALADAHLAMQDHKQAAAILSRLNEVKGGSFKTNWQLGVLYLERTKEPAKAAEALRMALEAGSECRDIRYHLGRALLAVGEEDEALKNFERAIAPLSDAEEATASREREFLSDSNKVSDAHLTLAGFAEKKVDTDNVRKHLSAAQKVAPSNMAVVEKLVKFHLDRGEVQEALLVSEKSIRYLSGNVAFVLMLCDALEAAGLADRRLKLLRAAHRRSPATPGLLELLVVAEAQHGSPETAKALLENLPVARSRAKEFSPAWEAIIKARIRRGDTKGAEKALKGLGDLTDTDTRFAVLWCRVLHLQGKGSDALEHARRATKRSPDAPTPYLVLGTVYRSLGMSREALLSIQKAIDLGAGAEARIQLAMVLWEGGFPEEASKQFVKVRNTKGTPRPLLLQVDKCVTRMGGEVTGRRRTGARPDIESLMQLITPPEKVQRKLIRQIHLSTYAIARYSGVVAGAAQMFATADERTRFKNAFEATIRPPGDDYATLQSELRNAVEAFAGAMAALVPDAKTDVDRARSKYVSAIAERPDIFGHMARAASAQADMASAVLRIHPRKGDLAARLDSILRRMDARQAVAPGTVQLAVSCDYATAEMLAALVDHGPQGFTYRIAVDRALSEASGADGTVLDAFAQLSVSRAVCVRLLRILCWQGANAARGEGEL